MWVCIATEEQDEVYYSNWEQSLVGIAIEAQSEHRYTH